jgi:predicted dehydrogenase
MKGGDGNKLRVGIAGFGVVGQKRKHFLEANPNISVVAVCDVKFSAEEILDNSVLCLVHYTQLFALQLDAIFVCLPNDLAAEVTLEALKNGLHVFCEKPPAQNVSDVKKVIATEAQNPKLKLMYGFNHRYHESVKDALNIIKSERFGKIINIRGLYGKAQLITFNQPDWRTKRSLAGGGVLLDQGIHMLDLMRLFAGEFSKVYSIVSNSHWGYDVEDNAYALMQTDSGVVGMINSSATQWRHRFNMDVNMEKGSLVLGGILSGTKSYGAETLTISEADPINDRGDPKEHIIKYNHDPSWKDEVDYFIDAIIENTPIKTGNSQDALRTMELVYKIYYSDKAWRKKFNILNPDDSE